MSSCAVDKGGPSYMSCWADQCYRGATAPTFSSPLNSIIIHSYKHALTWTHLSTNFSTQIFLMSADMLEVLFVRCCTHLNWLVQVVWTVLCVDLLNVYVQVCAPIMWTLFVFVHMWEVVHMWLSICVVVYIRDSLDVWLCTKTQSFCEHLLMTLTTLSLQWPSSCISMFSFAFISASFVFLHSTLLCTSSNFSYPCFFYTSP